MRKKSFFTTMALLFILSAVRMNAQVAIGSHESPQSFSQLEIVSGNNTGLRLPQISTTVQRDAIFTNAAGFKSNPLSKGLQIFNMETGCVETWNGTKWIQWCDDATTPGTPATAMNANNNPVLNINTAINPPIVTHTTSGATGIGTPNNLPQGVSASWVNGEIIISGTPTTAGTFEYSIPLLGGNGTETATGTITVKNCSSAPATPGAISGIPSSAINSGATFTATITAVTGATSYAWTLPSGLTGSSTTNSITITGTTAGTYAAGTISVIASNDCGNSSSRASTTAVTVNSCSAAPGTPGTISGIPSSAINLNATFTATITAVTGATSYAWTLPSGLTGTSTTNSITITGATAGTYAAGTISVIASNNCGNSSSRASATAVTVKNCSSAPSQPGTITISPSTVNLNATFTASVTNVAGATSYTWTLPSGLTGTSTTNSITITGATAGTYAAGTISVIASNDCGNSSSRASTTAVTVNNAISGCTLNTVGGGSLTFMNYNLGANTNVQTMSPAQQAAHTTPEDNCGDLYQWGRAEDGHQIRTSGTTPTLATSNTPNHTEFITSSSSDWLSGDRNDGLWGNGTKTANDPCPPGWRVPSITELRSIANGGSLITFSGSTTSGNYWKWNSSGTPGWLIYPNTAGTGAPALFLPAAGSRSYATGSLNGVGTNGYYWSSSVSSASACGFSFNSSAVNPANLSARGGGFSIRCVAE